MKVITVSEEQNTGQMDSQFRHNESSGQMDQSHLEALDQYESKVKGVGKRSLDSIAF